jgi:hypothetical protein
MPTLGGAGRESSAKNGQQDELIEMRKLVPDCKSQGMGGTAGN